MHPFRAKNRQFSRRRNTLRLQWQRSCFRSLLWWLSSLFSRFLCTGSRRGRCCMFRYSIPREDLQVSWKLDWACVSLELFHFLICLRTITHHDHYASSFSSCFTSFPSSQMFLDTVYDSMHCIAPLTFVTFNSPNLGTYLSICMWACTPSPNQCLPAFHFR